MEEESPLRDMNTNIHASSKSLLGDLTSSPQQRYVPLETRIVLGR